VKSNVFLCKTTSKTGYSKNLKLCIIKSIEENGRLPNINIKPSTLQYHINKLVSVGAIWKIGYGTWACDRDKFDQFLFKKELQKQRNVGNIRGHGFHWKINIPKIPKWNKREEYFKKNNIKYIRSSEKATWEGQRIIINNYKCWLHNESIVIYTPKGKSFFENTAYDAYLLGLNDVQVILRRLERLLKANVKIEGKYHIRACKQHYGKIKDAVASYYNNKKEKIRCFNKKGEEWLVIDDSFDLDETETLHPISARNDMDNGIVPFLNDLKEHLDNTGECLTMSGLLNICNQQQKQIHLLTAELESVKFPQEIKGLSIDRPDYVG